VANDKPPAWEVTGQVETVDLGPTGTFVQGVKVTFRTAAGSVGNVFIPSDQYTVERVRAAVSQKAATMDEAGSLRG
jgi:hypothetical protein